jgi:hypothetical protein
MRGNSKILAKGGQTKILEQELMFGSQQQVLRFEIAMMSVSATLTFT